MLMRSGRLGAAGRLPTDRKRGSQSPVKMRPVKRAVLDNGLRVFIVRAPELPVVSHMIWYTVGSRDERTGETGLSHFLEHMMFKGTDRYPKGSIDATTARLGGHNNAFTDHDTTAYYFNLKSDRWHEALAIEASRMRGCLLDDQEFQSEKKVVLEELSMGEDDEWRPIFQAVESVAFLTHPYHHPVIGWREDLERLERDTMVDYYHRHYAPDRAILVLVGDVKPNEALQRIEDMLGPVPASGRVRPPVLAEPPQRGERRIVLQSPHQLARLCLCWKGCRIGVPEDPVLDVVSALLGGGKASRFYRGLVQGRELVTMATAQNEARLDPGLFTIYAEAKPGQNPQAIESAILEEVDRLRDEGPKAAELRRVKKQIATSFFFDLETVSQQAMRIGRYEASCEDGWRVLERYPQELEAITAKDVRDVMKSLMRRDASSVGWSIPEGA
ncbi:MAG: insulinase family protein [Planctomycetes bacterium]|nr:insulinase family protein [Planctomycetota bacterium]